MRDQGRSRHRHRHRLREPDGGGRGGGDAVTAGGRRVGLGAAARGGHADLLLRGNGPALLTDTESSFNIINPLGTAFALPLSAADAAGTDRIAFVTVDSPAALVNFETAGPAILAQAGVEYELVKVPRARPT